MYYAPARTCPAQASSALHAILAIMLLICAFITAAAFFPNHALAAEETDQTEEPEILYTGQCGENAFWTCDSDGVLTITGEGAIVKKGYHSPDNFAVLDDIGMNHIYIHSMATSLIIGEGITSIEPGLFKSYKLVKSLTLPSTLSQIDENTFSGCRKIANVTFSGTPTIQRIGPAAFYDCRSLESFAIPTSVTTICEGAFEDCMALTKITAAKGSALTSIEDGAFRGCSALTTVSLNSAKLASIGAEAFKGCTGLKSLSFPASKSLSKIGAGAFESGVFTAKVTKAAAKKGKKLQVKWAKTQGATSYKLYYKPANAGKFKSTTLSTTSKTLTNLKKGKRYKVYVEAYLGKCKIAKSGIKRSGKIKK